VLAGAMPINSWASQQGILNDIRKAKRKSLQNLPSSVNGRTRAQTDIKSRKLGVALGIDGDLISDSIRDASFDVIPKAREAVKHGDCGALKDLLESRVDVNYVDHHGMSLLHLAVLFKHQDVARLLINLGADVHIRDSSGETAFEVADPTLSRRMESWTLEARKPRGRKQKRFMTVRNLATQDKHSGTPETKAHNYDRQQIEDQKHTTERVQLHHPAHGQPKTMFIDPSATMQHNIFSNQTMSAPGSPTGLWNSVIAN